MRLKIAFLLAWKITTVCSYDMNIVRLGHVPEPEPDDRIDDLTTDPPFDRNEPRINGLCNVEGETKVNFFLENFHDEIIIYSADKTDILYSHPQKCDYKLKNTSTVKFDSSCFSRDTLDVGPFEFYIVNAREIEFNPIATKISEMPEQTYVRLDCHTDSYHPYTDVQITDPETTDVSIWHMIKLFGDLTTNVKLKVNNRDQNNFFVTLGQSIELKGEIDMKTYRENAYVQSCQLQMPTAFNSYKKISLIENGCALKNFKKTEFQAFHRREGNKAFLVMKFKSFAFKFFRKFQIKCDMNNAPSRDEVPKCR